MIVMMIASTPSLNASSRFVSIKEENHRSSRMSRCARESRGDRGLLLRDNVRNTCAFNNLANRPRAQFLSANETQNRIGGIGGGDQGHADSHVEDLVKFVFRH